MEKPSAFIPKLELSKAKEIQDLIVKKFTNDEKKKQGNTVKEEKYRKLEFELIELKKKIGYVMVEKIGLEREINSLKRIVTELEERNTLLVDQTKLTAVEKQYLERYEEGQETLIDICRDVMMNERLKSVM